MTTVTIEVPDELFELITQAGDRLPELLTQSLRQPALSTQVYRYILDFIASNPSAEQIAAFGPAPEMTERLQTLLDRETTGEITALERAELDEYERLEHLIVLIKSNNLRYLAGTR
jgi:hypothetical protein